MLPQEGAAESSGYPGTVPDTPLPSLLLANSPGSPGATALLERARARGASLRILLSGAGLAWAGHTGLRPEDDVAVCSRNAGEAGWTLENTPPGIRWSSVATWLAELESDAPLWVGLP